MNTKQQRYLVIDLEGTCCDDGSIPDDERETIEIGAVLVDVDGSTVAVQCQFVRPILHQTLTDFCKNLTSIRQEDINNAVTFPKAWERLLWFMSCYNINTYCSWGDYDKHQFDRDIKHHGLLRSDLTHINLAKVFRQKYGRKRGSRGAMRYFGIEPTGTHHRGIDDARNIARMVPYLMGD